MQLQEVLLEEAHRALVSPGATSIWTWVVDSLDKVTQGLLLQPLPEEYTEPVAQAACQKARALGLLRPGAEERLAATFKKALAEKVRVSCQLGRSYWEEAIEREKVGDRQPLGESMREIAGSTSKRVAREAQRDRLLIRSVEEAEQEADACREHAKGLVEALREEKEKYIELGELEGENRVLREQLERVNKLLDRQLERANERESELAQLARKRGPEDTSSPTKRPAR